VTGIGNIANCYLSGTGFAFFDEDPPWSSDTWFPGEFRLTFSTQSPLRADDVRIPDAALATVSLCHTVRDTDTYKSDIPWALALDAVSVQTEFVTINGQTNGIIVVDITAGYKADCFMKGIAFQIGLLVYRPSLRPHQPRFLPRNIPLRDLLQVAGMLQISSDG